MPKLEPSDIAPPSPLEPTLPADHQLTVLSNGVASALQGLPANFDYKTEFKKIDATDLFHLNDLIGAQIEVQVVQALNRQREIWDPDNDFVGYTFQRQAQTFPDVRLVDPAHPDSPPLLGIELKGWFLLAKEGEASYRYLTTADACTDYDLLCIVPWYLDNVLSGAPAVAAPWVVSARWAAQARNHYWLYERSAQEGSDRSILVPDGASPYPIKADQISDNAIQDGGSNFGRVARFAGHKDFSRATMNTEVLGIRMADWASFLGRHTDTADADAITRTLQETKERSRNKRAADAASQLIALLKELGI